MKIVIALAVLCALAYTADCTGIHQWGTITQRLLCQQKIVVPGRTLRVTETNATCSTVSIHFSHF